MQNDESLDDYIPQKMKFYADRQLTPRLYVVLQGPLDNLQSYVVVESVRYSVSNPVRALDICFKIIKSLGCAFSHDSKLAWIYVEKFVYGIERSVPVTVKTLRSSILQHAQRSQPISIVEAPRSQPLLIRPSVCNTSQILHTTTPQTPSISGLVGANTNRTFESATSLASPPILTLLTSNRVISPGTATTRHDALGM